MDQMFIWHNLSSAFDFVFRSSPCVYAPRMTRFSWFSCSKQTSTKPYATAEASKQTSTKPYATAEGSKQTPDSLEASDTMTKPRRIYRLKSQLLFAS